MSSHDPRAGIQAVPGTILLLLLIVVVYGLPWIALLQRIRDAQVRRHVGWLQSDGSLSLFALRVLVFGMVLFPSLWIVISTTFTFTARGENVGTVGPLTGEEGSDALACAVAAMLIATICAAIVPRVSRDR